MPSTELWIGIGLSVAIVLSTTANVALRHFSRLRLGELLEERGRARWLERVVEGRHDYLVCTSFIRLSAILLLVLMVAHVLHIDPDSESWIEYLLVFLASLAVVMLTGVAIPNAWARYAGEPFLAAAAPVLLAMGYLLYPLTAFQRVVDGLIRRLAGLPDEPEEEAEAQEIEKEILDAVTQGELTGAVHEEDADMIESVMKFRDTDVAAIMTPRTEIVALPETCTLIEAKELIARVGHSRIPVFGENLDDIKGVLYAKDLLPLRESHAFDPIEVMRKVPFVPETKRVADLLKELREKKVHLAIVLDEYGGTAGLVTIEDIIEEIVGEIKDEYEPPEPEPFRRIDENTIEVDARMHIDELNEKLGVELPEDENYDTIGGFVFSTMGKIPQTGEEFTHHNLHFYVLDAQERKINRLRIKVVRDEAAV